MQTTPNKSDDDGDDISPFQQTDVNIKPRITLIWPNTRVYQLSVKGQM